MLFSFSLTRRVQDLRVPPARRASWKYAFIGHWTSYVRSSLTVIHQQRVWTHHFTSAENVTPLGKVRAPLCTTRRWWVDQAQRNDKGAFPFNAASPTFLPVHLSTPGHTTWPSDTAVFPPFTHVDWSNALFTSKTSATCPLDMATGVRSDGWVGHPEVPGACGVVDDGCSQRRREAGGDRGRRCLKSGLRDGAAGMLAYCLLSVALLSLLVRCAVAAEGKLAAELCAPTRWGTCWSVALASFCIKHALHVVSAVKRME